MRTYDRSFVDRGVLARPLFRLHDGLDLVRLPHLGDVVRQRIVGIGAAQQRLDGEQHRADLQRRTPLVLQDVQADPAQFVDVRVVDLREEADVGGIQGVVLREEQLELEEAALVGRAAGTGHKYVEVSAVLIVGVGANSGRRVFGEILGFH